MSYPSNNNRNSNGTSAPRSENATQKAIRENVAALIEQLEAGHSDALTAYLNAMSRFRNYSFGNILEIARQKPDATRVAGMYAWNLSKRLINFIESRFATDYMPPAENIPEISVHYVGPAVENGRIRPLRPFRRTSRTREAHQQSQLPDVRQRARLPYRV